MVLDLVHRLAPAEAPPVAGRVGSGVEVGDHQHGAGARDPRQFGIDRGAIRQVADHQPAPEDVETGVRQGQVAHVADHGLQPGLMPPLADTGVQHLGAEVDSHRQGGSGSKQPASGAASGVQQPQARERRRQIGGQLGLEKGDGGLVGIGGRP